MRDNPCPRVLYACVFFAPSAGLDLALLTYLILAVRYVMPVRAGLHPVVVDIIMGLVDSERGECSERRALTVQ